MKGRIKTFLSIMAIMLMTIVGIRDANSQELTSIQPPMAVGQTDTLKFAIEQTDDTVISSTYFKFEYADSVFTVDSVYTSLDDWVLVDRHSEGVVEVAMLSKRYRAFDGPFFSFVITKKAEGVETFTLTDLSWIDCNDIITIPPDTTTRPIDPTPEEVEALFTGNTYWIDASRGSNSLDCLSWDEPCRTDEPFRDILTPGDGVVLTGGIHRFKLSPTRSGTSVSSITYMGYPGRDVVMSGAEIWTTSWSNNGDGTWTMPYTQSLPEHPDEEQGEPKQVQYRPEVLIVDGAFYSTVYSKSDLVEGSFYVEGPSSSPSSITVMTQGGINPNSSNVEVGTLPQILEAQANVDFLKFENITFKHGPSSFGLKGCVEISGTSWELNNINIYECNTTGIRITGQWHVIRDSESSYNGMIGWYTNGADRVEVYDSRAVGNNTKGFLHDWHAGGFKLTFGSSYWIFDNFYSADNEGPGIWFDIPWNEHNIVQNSFFINNSMAGIMLEHGTVYSIIRNNVVYGTRKFNGFGPGFRIQAASDNLIENNTIFGNQGNGVRESLTDRRSPPGHNVFVRNIFTHNGGTTSNDYEFRLVRDPSEKIVDHFQNNIFVERPGLFFGAADHQFQAATLDEWFKYQLHSSPRDTLYSRSTPVIEDPLSPNGWRSLIPGIGAQIKTQE